MTRFFANACAALLCLTLAQVAHADATASKNFVDGLAKQVLNIVQADGDKAARTRKIEAIFANKVDINFVAKFAMGKYWRTATEAQRSAYVAAYKPFILKNYAGRLARYSGQTYTMKGARSDGPVDLVSMEINDTNGQKVLVDYRVSGGKINDIIVEGVSLLATQRSEFSSIIDQKGIDGLIDALKSQVASQS